MRINIEHATTYDYETPIKNGLQELRLTPKSRAGQTVLRWNIAVEGGTIEARFDDQHNNQVTLIGVEEGVRQLRVICDGEVETADNAGIIGRHGGFAPVWHFERETPLTKPGANLRRLARGVGSDHANDVDRMHALAASIAKAAEYRAGETHAGMSAEEALAGGVGVCQDHAHIFIACARHLGYPARYVSGYLLTDEETVGEASHAWAETFLENLGWVGFDVSNGISPDERYVRVATGLDYKDAAPTTGMTVGGGEETLTVDLRVTA